jgi:hypothetical protein
MRNPRVTGLLLLLTGVLVLMGNTMNVLPPAAFWAGLATYPIGGYLFFMGNRRAMADGEGRFARAPKSRAAPGEGHAQQQASAANARAPQDLSEAIRSFGAPAESRSAVPTRPHAGIASPAKSTRSTDQLVLYEIDADASDGAASGNGEFKVTSDVSFPTEENPEERSIADQLDKLSKLHRQGIITAEELSVAKAKLLG